MEPTNGPGTDGHLATVSYLFGAPAPSEQDGDAGTTPEGSDDAESSDLATAPSDLDAPAAGGSSSPAGWYLEPGAVATGDDEIEGSDSLDEAEPEPESIAAARRFLAAVGNGAAPRAQIAPDRIGSDRAAFPGLADDEAAPADTAPVKPPAVRRASINALARKGMSSAEMTTLLENREIEADEVAAEVARLEAGGLLDDRVLAEDLVRSLRDRKGLGTSAIAAELRRRRVDQSAIDQALESLDVDDELERATEVAIKRAGQLSSYDRTTAERRLSAFLQRRGYSGTVVGAAVKAALGPAGPRFR